MLKSAHSTTTSTTRTNHVDLLKCPTLCSSQVCQGYEGYELICSSQKQTNMVNFKSSYIYLYMARIYRFGPIIVKNINPTVHSTPPPHPYPTHPSDNIHNTSEIDIFQRTDIQKLSRIYTFLIRKFRPNIFNETVLVIHIYLQVCNNNGVV